VILLIIWDSILDSNKVIKKKKKKKKKKKSICSILPSVLTFSLFGLNKLMTGSFDWGTINFYVNISIYTVMFFNFSISSLATIKKLNILGWTVRMVNTYY